MRNAEVNRETGETKIQLFLDLDGTGKSNIDTGIGFMDHMLTLLAKHSGFDLMVHCDGDTYVDDHHSVEDIGISLGQAFAEAIGDKRGIYRYADTTLAMDEALILTSVDISGRSYLAYNMDIPTEKVGTFDTELAEEFILGFVRNANVTLHIRQLAGTNSHHIIEGMFKSLGHTLRKATEIDARFAGDIPSTKGRLTELSQQSTAKTTSQATVAPAPRMQTASRNANAGNTSMPAYSQSASVQASQSSYAPASASQTSKPSDGISRGLGDGSYAKGIAKGVTEALSRDELEAMSSVSAAPLRRTIMNEKKVASTPIQKKISSTEELEKELQEKGLL